MKILELVPTPHLYQSTKGGIEYRMWRGKTDTGIDVWVYVYCVYPAGDDNGSVKALKASLADFMSVNQDLSRTYTCDDDE